MHLANFFPADVRLSPPSLPVPVTSTCRSGFRPRRPIPGTDFPSVRAPSRVATARRDERAWS